MLFECADLLLEPVDVVGDAETGLVPGLLAKALGEALLELVNACGEANSTLVGVREVGLQGRPAEGLSDPRCNWSGLKR